MSPANLIAFMGLACLPLAIWGIASGLHAILFNMQRRYESLRDSHNQIDDLPLDSSVIWAVAYIEMLARVLMGACLFAMASMCLGLALA